MKVIHPPQPPPADVSEASLQRLIVDLAEYCGWTVRFNADSRRTQAGIPDLLLLRGPVCEWWELKTSRGRVRPEQVAFMRQLRAAGQVVRVVRPCDWCEVVAVLTREEGA